MILLPASLYSCRRSFGFCLHSQYLTRSSHLSSRDYSFQFLKSQRFNVSTMAAVNSSTYLEAVKHRRTVYGVTDNVSVSDDRIIEIVNEVIQTIPSSWNSQSTRIVVTLGKEHKKFWDVVIATAKPFMLENQSEEDWKRNEARFKSFQAAYGTVCVFPLVSETLLAPLPKQG
jgi:hypothetical protein